MFKKLTAKTYTTTVGDYEFKLLLGKGSFSDVWLAKEQDSDSDVAVKVLKDHEIQPAMLELMKQEVMLLSHLHHPHLSEVYHFGYIPEIKRYFYSSEYCTGKTFLNACEGNDFQYFETVLQQVLRALECIHSQGIIHFDVKSDNILVQETNGQPQAKLIDFNVALRKEQLTNSQRGTPVYWAPEIFLKSTSVDHRVDLYALGMLCYYFLMQRWPFTSKQLKDIREWHINGKIPEEFVQHKTIPDSLKELTIKLLAKRPSKRFSNATIALNFLNLTFESETEPSFSQDFLLPSEGPLIEREKEMSQILDTIDMVFIHQRSPFSHSLLLHGPIGSGKTRLLKEVRHELELKNISAIHFSFRKRQYQWKDFAEKFGLLHNVEDSLTDLNLINGVQNLKARAKTLLKYFRAHPCVFLIDDIHEADEEWQQLFKELKAQLHETKKMGVHIPFLLLETEKGDDVEIQEEHIQIELKPLSCEGIQSYLSLLFGQRKQLENLGEKLFHFSHGLPLLLIEGLKSVLPTFREGGDLDEVLKESNLDEIYQNRLDSLADEEREFLQCLSLIDRSIYLEELPQLFHFSLDECIRLVTRLQEKGLIQREHKDFDSLSGLEEISISSQSLSWAVQKSIPLHQVKNYHLKIAKGLDQIEYVTPDEKAHHFLHAEEQEQARKLYLEGAKSYYQQAQYHSAYFCYQEARKLISREDSSYTEITTQIIRLLIAMGSLKSAHDVLNGMTDDHIEIVELRAWLALNERKFKEAKSFFKRVLEKNSKEVSALRKMRLLIALGNIYLQEGDFQGAVQIFEDAYDLEKQFSATQKKKIINPQLGLAWLLTGQREQALTFFAEKMKDLSSYELSDQFGLLGSYGYALMSCGQLDQAAKLFEKTFQIADKTGLTHGLSPIVNNLLSTWMKQAEYGKCIQLVQKLNENQWMNSSLQDFLYYLLAQTSLWNRLGQKEKARQCLDQGISLCKESKQDVLPWFLLLQGFWQKEFGNQEEAKSFFLQLLRKEKEAETIVLWVRFALAEISLQEKNAGKGLSYLSLPVEEKQVDDELLARWQLLKIKLQICEHRSNDVSKQFHDLISTCQQKNQKDVLWEVYRVYSEWQKIRNDQSAEQESLKKAKALEYEILKALPEEYQDRYLYYQKKEFFYQQEEKEDTMSSQNVFHKILEINQKLIMEHHNDRLLEMILDAALELIQAEEGMILLLDANDAFQPQVARNLKKEDLDVLQFSQSIATKVAQTGQVICSQDASLDDNLNVFESVMAMNLKSVICVPLKEKNKTFGVIYLATQQRTTAISEDRIKFVEAFANQAALAIQNAKLFQEKERLEEQLKKRLDHTEQALCDKEDELHVLQSRLSSDTRGTRYAYKNIIGNSKKMESVLKIMDKITNAKVSVYVHGETGTGKELIARALHENSERKSSPFLAINCSAFSETLLESELFGHVKGAFTGADRDRKGMFELANGGTLFLDEVADMTLSMQAKILRVIQEQEVVRVGGNQAHKFDVRLVCATNKDLKQLIQEGKFREDLYFRLAGMTLNLPPLRERKEDLSLLVHHFLEKIKKENQLPKKLHLSQKAMKKVLHYNWPGNIRELEQCLTTACFLAERGVIDEENIVLQNDLYQNLSSQSTSSNADGISFDPIKKLKDYEKEIILKTLNYCEGNKSETAKVLGMSRLTLHKKVNLYGL